MRPFTITILTFLAILSGILGGCRGKNSGGQTRFSEPVYTPRYATGFEILGADGAQSRLLHVGQPWQAAGDNSRELFIRRNGEKVPDGFTGQVLEGDAQRIVCMSVTHVSMLDALGLAERIVGVSGIGFVANSYVAGNRDKIADVGYDENVDYELLMALKPDIVLLYGVQGASVLEPRLKELQIPFAYIGEYIEDSPLGKAEWLVAIGEIVGKRELAIERFAPIPQDYEKLKERVKEYADSPTVMLNAPYGDLWMMPTVSNYQIQLINDAGGHYLYDNNDTGKSVSIDIEKAYQLTAGADRWLNVGAYNTLADLKRDYPKFADTEPMRSRQVWNTTKRLLPSGANAYWEEGVLRPDLVLKDLIIIMHPGIFPETELTFYQRLE